MASAGRRAGDGKEERKTYLSSQGLKKQVGSTMEGHKQLHGRRDRASFRDVGGGGGTLGLLANT